jgi:hypothetical protein
MGKFGFREVPETDVGGADTWNSLKQKYGKNLLGEIKKDLKILLESRE